MFPVWNFHNKAPSSKPFRLIQTKQNDEEKKRKKWKRRAYFTRTGCDYYRIIFMIATWTSMQMQDEGDIQYVSFLIPTKYEP